MTEEKYYLSIIEDTIKLLLVDLGAECQNNKSSKRRVNYSRSCVTHRTREPNKIACVILVSWWVWVLLRDRRESTSSSCSDKPTRCHRQLCADSVYVKQVGRFYEMYLAHLVLHAHQLQYPRHYESCKVSVGEASWPQNLQVASLSAEYTEYQLISDTHCPSTTDIIDDFQNVGSSNVCS